MLDSAVSIRHGGCWLAVTLPMLLLCGCATHSTAVSATTEVIAPADSNIIAVQSVRLTAADHYIDLRYRVLDAQRAQQMLGPKVRPRLIDERTGIEMAVPTTAKLGSLRQTQAEQKINHTYFVMFINGANLQPGSKVTAELGPFTFAHLTVE